MKTESGIGNFIVVTYDTTQWEILIKTAKRLKMYTPKGCPFKNYSLFDLLKDWIRMYSWTLDKGRKYSLSDFVSAIRNRDEKVDIYGDTVIRLLEM